MGDRGSNNVHGVRQRFGKRNCCCSWREAVQPGIVVVAAVRWGEEEWAVATVVKGARGDRVGPLVTTRHISQVNPSLSGPELLYRGHYWRIGVPIAHCHAGAPQKCPLHGLRRLIQAEASSADTSPFRLGVGAHLEPSSAWGPVWTRGDLCRTILFRKVYLGAIEPYRFIGDIVSNIHALGLQQPKLPSSLVIWWGVAV